MGNQRSPAQPAEHTPQVSMGVGAPSKQPKTTTLQVRLEEEVRHNLDRYAEFVDANPSDVVSEALNLPYRKDREFPSWLTHQHTNDNKAILKGELVQLELN